MTNSGRLSPGDGVGRGPHTIDGDYLQQGEGSLLIDFIDPELHDLLQVSGRAELSGSLVTSWLGDKRPRHGDRFTIVSAGEIIGGFPDYTGVLSPTLFLRSETAPTRLFLEAERSYDNPALLARLQPRQRTLAANLLSRLLTLRAAGPPGNRAELLVPGGLPADLQDLGMVDSGSSRPGFFITGRLAEARQEGANQATGFDLTSKVITFGLDRNLGQGMVLGGFGAITTGETVMHQDAGSIDIQGVSLGIYGSWSRGGLHAEGMASYGLYLYDLKRNIVLPLENRRAEADPEGYTESLLAGLGYDFRFAGIDFGPVTTLQYSRTGIDGYQETGTGSLDLMVDDQHFDLLQAAVGIEFSSRIHSSWAELLPSLRLSSCHLLDGDSTTITSRLTDGDSLPFTMESDDPGNSFVTAHLGLSAGLTEQMLLQFDYGLVLEQQDYEEESVSLALQIKW